MRKSIFILAISALSLYFPVLSFSETAGTNVYEIRLKTGALKISLPEGWERRDRGQYDTQAGFAKREAESKLDILFISIFDMSDKPSSSTESSQKAFLDQIKNECYGKQEGYDGGEYTELFGVPVLIANFHRPDGTGKIKEVHFFKNRKYYKIDFLAYNEYFDALWVEIEKSIKEIEFLD
ncbi:MAG TPA: hypothetical protein VMD52_06770 [Patescibacteria group bacterium]|nr:hypothetical protein [Patescibacteria group bacterium]